MATSLGDLFLWFVDIWSQMRAGLLGGRGARRPLISLGAEGIRLASLDALQQGEIVEMPDLCARLQRIGQQHKSRSQECALRLEDVTGRTLMLQIANKSMLMDTQIGQRVLDGCVHEKQRAAMAAAAGQPAGEALLQGGAAASSAPK